MTHFSQFWNSLRGKITIGYYAVAAIILVISLFFVGELRALEERVVLGQRVRDLFDTVLEIRRFERNYFLYHQVGDLKENQRSINATRDLLTTGRPELLVLTHQDQLDQLQLLLNDYQQKMSSLVSDNTNEHQASSTEESIRALGKEIVAITEAMAGHERQRILGTLSTLRTSLAAVIFSVALMIVAIGRALSQRVVRPLKEMEASVATLPSERRESLSEPSNDREIISIIDAFNHMLKELDMRQKSLMRSERLASLGTMLFGVAHELNNPLSNISTSCQILTEEIEQSDIGTQKKYLNQIDQQTERARNIVRSLLDFSREKEFSKKRVLLKPLIRQTISFVRGKISAKSIVKLTIPEELSVYVDAQRLQQVFINLIRNALDVIKENGQIHISACTLELPKPPEGISFASGCQTKNDLVEIRVSDNGPGIASDHLPHIFDPFFTTKDVGYGMGLGLFVVYEIIEEHDGCISVQSAPDKGTTFCIRLPQENRELISGPKTNINTGR
jgi:two-component system NtrC family sensor kinase